MPFAITMREKTENHRIKDALMYPQENHHDGVQCKTLNPLIGFQKGTSYTRLDEEKSIRLIHYMLHQPLNQGKTKLKSRNEMTQYKYISVKWN